MKLNNSWKLEVRRELDTKLPVERTVFYRPAARWLIRELIRYGREYRVVKRGVGVVTITTDTTRCPCCGETLV